MGDREIAGSREVGRAVRDWIDASALGAGHRDGRRTVRGVVVTGRIVHGGRAEQPDQWEAPASATEHTAPAVGPLGDDFGHAVDGANRIELRKTVDVRSEDVDPARVSIDVISEPAFDTTPPLKHFERQVDAQVAGVDHADMRKDRPRRGGNQPAGRFPVSTPEQ